MLPFNLDSNVVNSPPSAMLWLSSLLNPLHELFSIFAFSVLCEKGMLKGCQTCFSCIQIKKKMHPDIQFLFPEKLGQAIKIEQIRSLQENAFYPPQAGLYRLICISPATALNDFSLNALLKLLEEPPDHLKFVLFSEHQCLPKTLLSRCQKYFFYPEKTDLIDDYWLMDVVSGRMDLYEQREILYGLLYELEMGKVSVFDVVDIFLKYDLKDIFWFFYTLVSLLIVAFMTIDRVQKQGIAFLNLFKAIKMNSSIDRFYERLDVIGSVLQQLHQQTALNARLLLERFFYEWSNHAH